MRAHLVVLSLALGLLSVPSCQSNVTTMFPEGFEPWEAHLAPLPTATATDPCPEEFVVERAPSWSGAWNVHGTGCIHAPIETVYASAQEPYTTRDPINSTTFMAIDPPMAGECDGDYQTEVFVDNAVDAFDVLFRTCWRHAEVTRSDEGALEVTATRWQKVFGSSYIPVMEGSLVLEALDGHPDITVVRYQYHLDAVSSSSATVENFITLLYTRLRTHAHGEPLDP